MSNYIRYVNGVPTQETVQGTDLGSGAATSGQVLTANGTGGTAWSPAVQSTTAPTKQVFLSGSGTYTTPTNPAPLYIKVTMAGGGGGGAGASGAGGNGNNTTFGSNTAGGGSGAASWSNVTGGSGGTNTVSGVTVLINQTGGVGGSGSNAVNYATGGVGGSNPFGGVGAGNGSSGASAVSGGNAIVNTGAGGGGGTGGTSTFATAGGGSGGYLQFLINSPGSSYSYSVGSGGSGGSGTWTGGNGGSGIIIVEEYYGTFGSAVTASASYAQGYSSGAYWATTSSTYVSPTPTGTSTLTVRKSNNLTITQAASNVPGITFTPASSTAVYQVNACFGVTCNAANSGISVQLWDGTNYYSNASGGFSTSGINPFEFISLNAIVVPGSASPITLSLIASVTAGGTGSIEAINGAGNSAYSVIEWTVTRIDSVAVSGGSGGGVLPFAASYGYSVGNIISYANNMYICTTNHTSASTFEADIANWALTNSPQLGRNLLTVDNNIENGGVGAIQAFTVSGYTAGTTPTTSPTLGSGASIGLSAQSSGALTGSYSLQLTTSTTFTAGQGFASAPITVDPASQAKMHTIQFDYSVTAGSSNMNLSGTSSNTLHVYIWDATNSAWIQPINVYGMAAKQGHYFGQFQMPYNTTSCYLMVLVGNANTSGTTTVLFDNFFVGQAATAGFAAGPTSVQTFTSGSGTYIPSAGTTQIKVRMAGGGGGGAGASSAGGNGGNTTFGSWTAGGGTGAATGGTSLGGAGGTNTTSTGSLLANLVGGMGETGNGSSGSGAGGSGGVNPFGGSGAGGNPTSTTSGQAAAVNTGSGGGGNGWVNAVQNANGGGGAGGYLEFILTSPASSYSYAVGTGGSAGTGSPAGGAGGSGIIIVEEYKTAQIVSQYDGRAVVANYTTASGTINSGNITYTTLVSDSMHAYSGGIYTIPVSGNYNFAAAAAVNVTSGSYANIIISKNGTAIAANEPVSPSNFTNTITPQASINGVPCVAGDQITVQVNGNGSPTLNNTAGYAYFSVSLASGSQQILAGQQIACQYTGSGEGASASSAFGYNTKVYDLTGSYNTSTGIYTCPTSGFYLINANMFTAASQYLYVQQNSTTVLQGPFGSSSSPATITYMAKCNAGDTLAIFTGASGTTSGGTALNNLTIKLLN